MSAPTTDRGAIRRVIQALADETPTIFVVDDGGDAADHVVTAEPHYAVEAVMAVDEARVFLIRGGVEVGWVFFVLGNEPFEVVNDHTVNLTVVDALTSSWD